MENGTTENTGKYGVKPRIPEREKISRGTGENRSW